MQSHSKSLCIRVFPSNSRIDTRSTAIHRSGMDFTTRGARLAQPGTQPVQDRLQRMEAILTIAMSFYCPFSSKRGLLNCAGNRMAPIDSLRLKSVSIRADPHGTGLNDFARYRRETLQHLATVFSAIWWPFSFSAQEQCLMSARSHQRATRIAACAAHCIQPVRFLSHVPAMPRFHRNVSSFERIGVNRLWSSACINYSEVRPFSRYSCLLDTKTEDAIRYSDAFY
jgi:hypothetical protein